MLALYPQTSFGYLAVLLIFFRLLGVFLLAPGFSHTAVPMTVKILLAFSIALAVHPLVGPLVAFESNSLAFLIASVVRESAIGFLMGFVAYVTFEGIALAAQFVGYQMGLGTVGMLDPEHNSQVSGLVPFQGWVALMIFFVADLHHHVLAVFVESFRVTSGFEHLSTASPEILKFMMGVTGKLFVLGVQLAAPITVLVLSTNVVIGMLARMMPQINILLFSFPITITLGLVGVYLVAPELIDSMETVMGQISTELMTMVRIL